MDVFPLVQPHANLAMPRVAASSSPSSQQYYSNASDAPSGSGLAASSAFSNALQRVSSSATNTSSGSGQAPAL